MLQELSIRNFAIIEDLNIRFEPGLTILSGETGAGKSIIINAVNLLLGSRASAALIRTGAESAELEALFDIPVGSNIAGQMAEAGFDAAEGLLVRRIISNQERHRIYINGRLATMQLLGDLTSRLASISGQHAHQGLLKEEAHLFILDQFGDLIALRNRYGEEHARMLPLIREEQSLRARQARQDEQVELLRFQLQEIETAALLPDEDESLEKERLRLKNGEALYQTVHECIEALYSGDGAVFEILGQTVKALDRMGRIDDQLQIRTSELEEVTYRVEDVAGHLRDYLQRIDLDPGRLEAVEARLDLLNRLKRKYGGSLASVCDHAEEITLQLKEIEALDDTIEQVGSELKKKHLSLSRLAGELSDKRRKVAAQLSQKVERELAELKMAGTRFVVDLQSVKAGDETAPFLSNNGIALTESGSDRAVFMMAPNVGETIKPLASIASGGELSRVVLALKAILAHNDALETVVFDEVDAGIGGGVADMVGRKLAGLADNHQVLCITHLPQIAKYGEHHFRIAKRIDRGRTHTTITPLTPEARIEEMARMLGGEEITATTLAHAREMLSSGR